MNIQESKSEGKRLRLRREAESQRQAFGLFLEVLQKAPGDHEPWLRLGAILDDAAVQEERLLTVHELLDTEERQIGRKRWDAEDCWKQAL